MTLIIFHTDISGNNDKEEHLLNILLIFWTLIIFHLDISGKDIRDEHPLKKKLIFQMGIHQNLTILIFYFMDVIH